MFENIFGKAFGKSKAAIKKDSVILRQAKKNNEVIYGAKAMNAQLPPVLQRDTFDFDVFSRTPLKSAKMLERKMDKIAGSDNFYVKEALHPGTFKVMNIGGDLKKNTKDDFNIADYTGLPVGLRTVNIGGVKHASLSEIKKDRVKSLNDPMSAFRHDKDKKDLKRLSIAKRLRSILP